MYMGNAEYIDALRMQEERRFSQRQWRWLLSNCLWPLAPLLWLHGFVTTVLRKGLFSPLSGNCWQQIRFIRVGRGIIHLFSSMALMITTRYCNMLCKARCNTHCNTLQHTLQHKGTWLALGSHFENLTNTCTLTHNTHRDAYARTNLHPSIGSVDTHDQIFKEVLNTTKMATKSCY